MKRSVQQPDDHRPGAHDPQDPAEIAGLKFLDLVQGFVEILHSLGGVSFILRSEHPVVVLLTPGLGGLGIQQHLADGR